jgi:hypothetical protein
MRTPNSQALNLWTSGSRFGAAVRITDARCAFSGSSLWLVGKSMKYPTLPENKQKSVTVHGSGSSASLGAIRGGEDAARDGIGNAHATNGWIGGFGVGFGHWPPHEGQT